MTTRLSPERQSHSWPYPTDLAGFLEAVRADLDDKYNTWVRVKMSVRLSSQCANVIDSLLASEFAKGQNPKWRCCMEVEGVDPVQLKDVAAVVGGLVALVGLAFTSVKGL